MTLFFTKTNGKLKKMNSTAQQNQQDSAFTLIELAIVLALISLIISGGLSYTIAQREEKRFDLTHSKLNFVMKSIKSFVRQNGYLPCPTDPTLPFSDADFGFGKRTGGGCSSGNLVDSDGGASTENIIFGAIPVYTLNIPPDYIYDGWNRRFTYAVDEDMTDTTGYAANTGDIEIRSPGYDGGGTARNNPITYRHADAADVTAGILDCEGDPAALGACITMGAPVAVISHGSNGFGSYGAAGGAAPIASTKYAPEAGSNDEDENADHLVSGANNHILIQSLRRGDYDDLIRFKMKWQLETD